MFIKFELFAGCGIPVRFAYDWQNRYWTDRLRRHTITSGFGVTG